MESALEEVRGFNDLLRSRGIDPKKHAGILEGFYRNRKKKGESLKVTAQSVAGRSLL